MATARLNSHARREAILDAAINLFSEKGFRGVTTRELAGAVGVTEPVLYQHFETKRDLYRALIEERAVVGDDPDPTCFPHQREFTGDDRQFLLALANGIIQWHASHPEWVRLLLFSALEQHELSELFFERYSRAFFRELATFFGRRITEGAFREMDPMIAAHTFVALTGHYGMNRAIFHKTALDIEHEQVVEGSVDIFLEGMKKR